MGKTRPYREALLQALADPIEAAHYLNAAMGDSPEMFRKALRNVAQARQMAKVAREAGVTRESLYRATSEIGNPTLDTLYPVLAAVGIKIRFEAEEAAVTPAASAPTATSASRMRSSVYHSSADKGCGFYRPATMAGEPQHIGSGKSLGYLIGNPSEPPAAFVGSYANVATNGMPSGTLPLSGESLSELSDILLARSYGLKQESAGRTATVSH